MRLHCLKEVLSRAVAVAAHQLLGVLKAVERRDCVALAVEDRRLLPEEQRLDLCGNCGRCCTAANTLSAFSNLNVILRSVANDAAVRIRPATSLPTAGDCFSLRAFLCALAAAL